MKTTKYWYYAMLIVYAVLAMYFFEKVSVFSAILTLAVGIMNFLMVIGLNLEDIKEELKKKNSEK